MEFDNTQGKVTCPVCNVVRVIHRYQRKVDSGGWLLPPNQFIRCRKCASHARPKIKNPNKFRLDNGAVRDNSSNEVRFLSRREIKECEKIYQPPERRF